MSIATFEEAVETISNKMNKTMSNDELKEIYALYKQATVGDVNVDRPGMFSHHLEISYYVNFLGHLSSNGFQLK